MRFGVFTSLTGQTWSGVLELWRHIEKMGWDTACVTDHFMPNTRDRDGAVLESWSTLAALAAVIPRMRVGTIVLGNTYRPPAIVAKMAAQVPALLETLSGMPLGELLGKVRLIDDKTPKPSGDKGNSKKRQSENADRDAMDREEIRVTDERR